MPTPPSGPFSAAQLAEYLGATVTGDGARLLSGVRALEDAGPAHLSFLSNRRYVRQARTTLAGALLLDLSTALPDDHPAVLLRCADPYAAFARALRLFHPEQRPEPGISPQAHVHPSAQVAPSATVEAFAWIGPDAVIGAGCWIEAGVRVGAGAVVGADCRLMANSVVCDGCCLGARVWLNPGAVVGAEGFGFAPTATGNLKIPQVGRAVLEDDVELGANTCVDRAALAETRVGQGTKTDNLVQIGHAAQVGRHNLMVAYAGVAGSSRLGERVVLAARAAVLGHITVGDGAQVGVSSAVHGDVPPGARVTGVPAIEHRTWLRAASAFGDLPDLMREVRRLEARVETLEATLDQTAPEPADHTLLPTVADGVAMDIQKVLSLLPHRYPFLMLDRVLEVEPGVRAVGVKCVTANEPHFQGHFPGQPIMPGVLITEAFAQLAGIVAMTANPDFTGKTVYLLGLDKVRFRRPVTPGDRLLISCQKVFERRGVWKFSAWAEVDSVRVADGEVMATVADRPETP